MENHLDALYWILLFVDLSFLHYLIFGDKPYYRFILFRVFGYLFGLIWKGNNSSSNSRKSFLSHEPEILDWNSSRQETFTLSAHDSIEDIFSKHTQSVKNMELNREAEKANNLSRLKNLEYKLKSVEGTIGKWRIWVKILGLIVLSANFYMVNYIKEHVDATDNLTGKYMLKIDSGGCKPDDETRIFQSIITISISQGDGRIGGDGIIKPDKKSTLLSNRKVFITGKMENDSLVLKFSQPDNSKVLMGVGKIDRIFLTGILYTASNNCGIGIALRRTEKR